MAGASDVAGHPARWAHDVVCQRLVERLAEPLPGVEAQRLMAPSPRAGWRPAEIPADARPAAGLVLIYPFRGEAHLVLTVRSARLLNHSGQVSLPGGRVEPGETFEDTALREAEEEAGVDRGAIRLIGTLTPLHIPVSRFVLYPVVACTHDRPSFLPAELEVARVLDVPLAQLADPLTVRARIRLHEGREYEIPYFAIEDQQVWGATAMVLSELLAVLNCPPTVGPIRPHEAMESPIF